MPPRQKDTKIWDYFDKVYKVGSFLGIVGILWLNSHYVTVERFEATNKENTEQHLIINESLNKIALTLAIMENNSVAIKDHEARLRAVETRQTDVISRITTLERLDKK